MGLRIIMRLKMIQWFQLDVASFKIAAEPNDSRQLTSSKTANRYAHSDALIARPFERRYMYR